MKKEKIAENLIRIDEEIKEWEKDVSLNGKNIQVAIVQQPSLLARYDQLASEADFYVDYTDMLVKKIRGEILKRIKDNYSKDYTDTAINKVIDSHPDYIKIQELYLECKLTYTRCKSLVEAFKQRSYSLNNLVKVYEHELDNITIRIDE